MKTTNNHIELDTELGLAVGERDEESGIWLLSTPYGDSRFHGDINAAKRELRWRVVHAENHERRAE